MQRTSEDANDSGPGEDVEDLLNPKALLIVAAVGTYVLGFLFRDQIYTRMLVVLGSLLYICYYAIAGPTPLWDAIIGSALIALASLQGVLRLWWSRLEVAVPRKARDIYKSMGDIEPGLFRQLLKAGDRMTVDTRLPLLAEGKTAPALWYLASGSVSLEREGHAPVRLASPGFFGEIAWLTGNAASATVTAEPGAELLRWRAEDLRRASRRSQRMELALDAMIARDLAEKLARSTPIEQVSSLRLIDGQTAETTAIDHGV